MKLKKLIRLRHCLKCRDCCCLFDLDGRPYAPIFTKEEVKRIKIGKRKIIFKRFNGSDKVFQINLKKSKNEKDLYVCPFFNEKKKFCQMEKVKPFDCRFWPFILTSDKSGHINVSCFSKHFCLGLQRITVKEFDDYVRYLDSLIENNKILNLLKKFPEVVWSADEDASLIKRIR